VSRKRPRTPEHFPRMKVRGRHRAFRLHVLPAYYDEAFDTAFRDTVHLAAPMTEPQNRYREQLRAYGFLDKEVDKLLAPLFDPTLPPSHRHWVGKALSRSAETRGRA
jgi:hypothetical protein